MIANEEPLVFGFAPFRLDSHLILNALNNLGMALYTQSGVENPAVALLADYIIAEHGVGQNMSLPRVHHPLSDEWEVCKAMLSLKAALVGTRLSFRESGDLAALRVPDHALAALLRDVFAGWPGLAAHDVRLTLSLSSPDVLQLSAVLKLQPNTGRRQPFLGTLLDSGRLPRSGLGEFELLTDDGYGWTLDIQLLDPQDQ